MWEDWEQQLKDNPDVEVEKILFWECNMNDFDWQKSKRFVIERVINIGGTKPKTNMLALFKMYGGYEGVRNSLKNEVWGLSNFGEEFVCKAFNLKQQELESYRRKQKRIAIFGEPVDKTDWWQRMLFKETVEKDTLSILETLQKDEKLSNFYLVGGTALALNLGHRKSIDLDMFSPFSFDTEQLLDYLSEKYEFVRINPFAMMSKIILQGKIKDVKVDWVVNAYPKKNK